MRLEPRDLGDNWHIRFVRERTRPLWRRLLPEKTVAPEPRLGVLGRAWQKGVGISPRAAAETFPLSAKQTLPWVYGVGGAALATGLGMIGQSLGDGNAVPLALGLGVGGAGGWLGFVGLPRRALRKLHRRPLTIDEIEATLGSQSAQGPLLQRVASQIVARLGPPSGVSDPLEKAFLMLVLETIRRGNDVPANAEDDVRNAIRALGEAIAGLPVPPATSDALLELRQQASALLARARDESDAVVASSLERQAEALVRQAAAAGEANQTARRVRVLRQEMLTQIESLRAGIGALASCRADELARCAESVRAVAAEAVSVARARDELRATSSAEEHENDAGHRRAAETELAEAAPIAGVSLPASAEANENILRSRQ